MGSPNIFAFATSELSQDAFLCWVIANASNDERPDLRGLGRAFVAWLFRYAREEKVTVDDVRLVGGPRRQVKHVDICFEAEVGGRPFTFLIEDKTLTSQHSDQLARYASLFKGVDLVPIYFKTGYHFPIDVEAKSHGYAVVELRDWVGFLDAHSVANDIFADYRAWMKRQLTERETSLAALLASNGHGALQKDFVQYDFVRRLAARCGDTIGAPSINHGTSIGGEPWTHYRFASFLKVLPGDIDEALFHRVDKRDGGFYLSTRQYAVVKGKPSALEAKRARLKAHVEAFERALLVADAGLRFEGRRSTRGANESEIAVLFFDTAQNSVAAVLERFGAVHAAFVNELRKAHE